MSEERPAAAPGEVHRVDAGVDDRGLPDYPRMLRRLAELYGWDMDPAYAPEQERRVLLRVMDMGLWEDVLAVERLAGPAALRRLIRDAPVGALSPRAWSFWHYRLDLVQPGAPVPSMPLRRTA